MEPPWYCPKCHRCFPFLQSLSMRSKHAQACDGPVDVDMPSAAPAAPPDLPAAAHPSPPSAPAAAALPAAAAAPAAAAPPAAASHSPALWSPLPLTAARHAHAAFVVGKRLYIHGGCGDVGMNHFLDDLLILDPESSTWKAAQKTAAWPSPRGFHTATALEANSNRVIIFGGRCAPGNKILQFL